MKCHVTVWTLSVVHGQNKYRFVANRRKQLNKSYCVSGFQTRSDLDVKFGRNISNKVKYILKTSLILPAKTLN